MRLFASAGTIVLASVLAGLTTAASAADYGLAGEGSWTDNPHLYVWDGEPRLDPGDGSDAHPAPLVKGDGSDTDNPHLRRRAAPQCPNCASHISPQEWGPPPFDIDWQVALRGGYELSTAGSGFVASIAPRVASAEIVKTPTDALRLAAATVDLDGTYELSSTTLLFGSAQVSLTQDKANPPAVISSRQVLAGTAEAGVTHTVGSFDLSARGNVGRTVNGPTTLAGGVIQDNSWENTTTVGAGLRASYPVTPLIGVFVDGSARYQFFDGPSPTLLAKLDGSTLAAKVGVSYALNSVLSAEASVGVGVRQFDAGFPDATGTLYDARISFRPDETLTFNASLSTDFTPPAEAATGVARLKYTAAADVAYKVNPWLVLRASADGYTAKTVGAVGYETGYGLGAGADYLLNRHATLTADYTFDHKESGPPALATDTHRLMLGVTFSK
jgi:hypothetical protein